MVNLVVVNCLKPIPLMDQREHISVIALLRNFDLTVIRYIVIMGLSLKLLFASLWLFCWESCTVLIYNKTCNRMMISASLINHCALSLIPLIILLVKFHNSVINAILFPF